MRTNSPLVALLGWLAMTSAPARADDTAPVGSSACATIGQILGRARASGPLARVLGTRDYLLKESGRTYVLSVSIRDGEGDAPELACEIAVRGTGTVVFSTVSSATIGPGGELRHFHVTNRVPSATFEATLEAQGDRLVGSSTRVADGETGEALSLELGPIRELSVAALVDFVLPFLFDQGLPERLDLRTLLAGDGVLIEPTTIVLAPDLVPTSAGPARVIAITSKGATESVVRVLADGDHVGACESMIIDGKQHELTPVSAAEAARLLTGSASAPTPPAQTR